MPVYSRSYDLIGGFSSTLGVSHRGTADHHHVSSHMMDSLCYVSRVLHRRILERF